MRRLLAVSPLVILLVPLGMAATPTAGAQPAAALRLPFPAGTAWKVAQGYQGGTHGSGPERYALDLVRDGDGPTAGVEVLAPAAGTLWFMNAPGAGNGCLSLKIDGGGGLIAQMCHIVARSFRRDEPIAAGQVIGTIGAAGTVGNNGLAHLHLSLHRTPDFGTTRIPAPFAAPDGLPLDGIALPPDGSSNQYVCPGATCRSGLVSSNGRAADPAPAVPPAAPGNAPVMISNAPAMPLRPGLVARIAVGSGCVNLREGPGMTARVLTCLPDGFTATIAQGPLVADNSAWWRLENWGWVAGDYLAGVSLPAPAVRVGAVAVVDAGAGDCLNLRDGPGIAAGVVTCLPSGARLAVTDGPREADGRTWWQLDGRGWAAGDYLRP